MALDYQKFAPQHRSVLTLALLFDASTFAPGQSPIETIDQAFITERLAQKPKSTGLHGARSYSILGKGRYENNRHVISRISQTALQLETAQARHLHICNEARCVIYAVRFQEFLRG